MRNSARFMATTFWLARVAISARLDPKPMSSALRLRESSEEIPSITRATATADMRRMIARILVRIRKRDRKNMCLPMSR